MKKKDKNRGKKMVRGGQHKTMGRAAAAERPRETAKLQAHTPQANALRCNATAEPNRSHLLALPPNSVVSPSMASLPPALKRNVTHTAIRL